VILALLTLLLASFGLYHDLGVPLAIGIVVMLLAGLTLLPALLAISGAQGVLADATARRRPARGIWGKVASTLVRRPKLTLAVGVLLFGGWRSARSATTRAASAARPRAPKGSSAARATR
jgi:RND superfamily putative drug exporter